MRPMYSLLRCRRAALPCRSLRFIGRDGVGLLKGQANIIEAVEETVAAERIYLEGGGETLIIGHPLRFKIYGHFVTWRRFCAFQEQMDGLFGQGDRKQPVLKAVVIEDIGKRGRENGLEAIVCQRPRRVFTGG